MCAQKILTAGGGFRGGFLLDPVAHVTALTCGAVAFDWGTDALERMAGDATGSVAGRRRLDPADDCWASIDQDGDLDYDAPSCQGGVVVKLEVTASAAEEEGEEEEGQDEEGDLIIDEGEDSKPDQCNEALKCPGSVSADVISDIPPKSKSGKVPTCTFCKSTFGSSSALQAHVKAEHFRQVLSLLQAYDADRRAKIDRILKLIGGADALNGAGTPARINPTRSTSVESAESSSTATYSNPSSCHSDQEEEEAASSSGKHRMLPALVPLSKPTRSRRVAAAPSPPMVTFLKKPASGPLLPPPAAATLPSPSHPLKEGRENDCDTKDIPSKKQIPTHLQDGKEKLGTESGKSDISSKEFIPTSPLQDGKLQDESYENEPHSDEKGDEDKKSDAGSSCESSTAAGDFKPPPVTDAPSEKDDIPAEVTDPVASPKSSSGLEEDDPKSPEEDPKSPSPVTDTISEEAGAPAGATVPVSSPKPSKPDDCQEEENKSIAEGVLEPPSAPSATPKMPLKIRMKRKAAEAAADGDEGTGAKPSKVSKVDDDAPVSLEKRQEEDGVEIVKEVINSKPTAGAAPPPRPSAPRPQGTATVLLPVLIPNSCLAGAVFPPAATSHASVLKGGAILQRVVKSYPAGEKGDPADKPAEWMGEDEFKKLALVEDPKQETFKNGKSKLRAIRKKEPGFQSVQHPQSPYAHQPGRYRPGQPQEQLREQQKALWQQRQKQVLQKARQQQISNQQEDLILQHKEKYRLLLVQQQQELQLQASRQQVQRDAQPLPPATWNRPCPRGNLVQKPVQPERHSGPPPTTTWHRPCPSTPPVQQRTQQETPRQHTAPPAPTWHRPSPSSPPAPCPSSSAPVSGGPTVRCPCGVSFSPSDPRAFQRHLWTHHKRFYCCHCGRYFPSQAAYDHHVFQICGGGGSLKVVPADKLKSSSGSPPFRPWLGGRGAVAPGSNMTVLQK